MVAEEVFNCQNYLFQLRKLDTAADLSFVSVFSALNGHFFFIFNTAVVAAEKLLPVLHYDVLYIVWSFVNCEAISGFLKNYMNVTDVA